MVALVLFGSISGCASTGGREYEELLLRQLATPPDHYANVTAEDLATYPILERLFEKVQPGVTARESNPYEDSVRLTKVFQDRDPGPWWKGPSYAYVSHDDGFYDLTAKKAPVA
ncbi:MAG: hypothetical protein HY556_09930 [Euryarchaeota archaeon]|nr:hypothetical protein [Euryarchaeota archaeon]